MAAWNARVDLKPWRWEQELHIWRSLPDRIEVVQPFVIKSYERGAGFSEESPTMRGDADDVKQFMQGMLDAAWAIGLRPAGFENHTNELKAVRDHLADMRSLALTADSPVARNNEGRLA